jgi:DNA-binding GntR family transcriptional regulator
VSASGTVAPPRVGDQHRPLRDVVCDAIRSEIVAGSYAPGERLIEDRLAESLGVSRNPVREALRVLEAEGFVRMLPRRGAVVAELSIDEVVDLFEVRMVLEGLAARLAARKATDEEILEIRALLERRRPAAERRDVAKLGRFNSTFHEMVIAAAKNKQLAEITIPLRGRLQWLYYTSHMDEWHRSMGDHQELLEAIEARDEKRAEEVAIAHVAAARDWYLSTRAPAS